MINKTDMTYRNQNLHSSDTHDGTRTVTNMSTVSGNTVWRRIYFCVDHQTTSSKYVSFEGYYASGKLFI